MKYIVDIDEEIVESVKYGNVYIAGTRSNGKTILCKITDAIANATPLTDRLEYGTDGEVYKMSISNGSEFTDCTDAISRSAVIEKITMQTVYSGEFDGVECESVKHLIEIINSLPTVNPAPDLSKIRAEIEDELVHDDWDIGNEYIYNNAIRDVLDIIDKYSKGGGSDE